MFFNLYKTFVGIYNLFQVYIFTGYMGKRVRCIIFLVEL